MTRMAGIKYEVNNCYESENYGAWVLGLWWAPWFVFSLGYQRKDMTCPRFISWSWLSIPRYNLFWSIFERTEGLVNG